jgi:hypothetical protein
MNPSLKLLGHTSPEMTMQYLDVTLNDLQRAFDLARSKPRHLVPDPKTPLIRAGLDGLIDSLLAAQHVLEMFRRTLANNPSRRRLDRLQPAYQNHYGGAQARDTLKMGRDWPVKPVTRAQFF